MVAKAITINTPLGNGRDEADESTKQFTTTPKGRTRRTIPMTSTLFDALKALDVVREGYVVRNMDGTPMSDAQTSHETYRICRKAGLPERGWHQLRHNTEPSIIRRAATTPVRVRRRQPEATRAGSALSEAFQEV